MAVLLLLFAMLFPCFVARAQTTSEQEAQTEQEALFAEQWQLFGGDLLWQQLPEQTKDLLSQLNIHPSDPQSLLSLSLSDGLWLIWQLLAAQMKQPLTLLGASVGLLLLAGLLRNMGQPTTAAPLLALLEVMTAVAVLSAISLPVLSCVQLAEDTLKAAEQWMLMFVPLMAAVLTAMAKGVTAVAFQGFLVGAIQLVGQLITGWLLPFLNIYLAFCLVGGTDTGKGLNQAAEGWRKGITAGLCGLLTLLLGFWGLQKALAGGADTLALRTGKLAISGLVPVVGGALSEAVGSVTHCMGMVKNTMGGFALLALCGLMLPAVVQTVAYLAGLWMASVAANLLQAPEAARLIEAVCQVLKLLLAGLAVFFVLLLFSTAMLVGNLTG